MISILRKILFKVSLRFCNEYEKAAIYGKYLGVKFGKNVRITKDANFGSEPYLITIGDDVTITEGVTFHTHDGGVGVLRSRYPGIDVIKPVKIGNNVFIGFMVNIMPGVTIGNNVIIGAGSLVTKDVPNDVVIAGVPARVLKSLEEYEKKVLKEAIYIKNRDNTSKRKIEILEFLYNK